MHLFHKWRVVGPEKMMITHADPFTGELNRHQESTLLLLRCTVIECTASKTQTRKGVWPLAAFTWKEVP